MSPEGYAVSVLDEVKTIDMPALAVLDPAAPRAAAEIVRDLHSDPWLGQEMRARTRLEVLETCRKVPFDVPGHQDKPRFRLVYRNDPSDGSIAVVTILAVGAREELAAYRKAASRAGAEARRRGRDERA
jgi:hypothetical protein